MKPNESSIGIALVSDESGLIRYVLQNDFSLNEGEMLGRYLPTIFEESESKKALSFFSDLKKLGILFDYELGLPVEGRVILVHCAGLAFDKGLLVLASPTRLALQDFFERIAKINNRQANHTLEVSKRKAALDASESSREIEFFDEMTSTNNELVTLQREVQQKNAQLERLTAEVQALARTDPLTGVFNRRGFFEMGNLEVARARRFNKPLAGIMLDVDHFKTFNDTYGHATGDQVLKEVTERCRKEVREVDVFGRYGGEEFCVLLSESNSIAGNTVAEKLRSIIHDTSFKTIHGPLDVTISLGVATLLDPPDGLDELLVRADLALYSAKESGRNRVGVASP